MPIKVTCKCGQSFAAKEQLAGKAVKCPNCAQPIRIPAPKQKPTAGQPSAAPASGGIGDLLDEVGMGGHEHDEYTGPRCPSCDAPLAQNAALCVECGYNLQSGKFVKGMGGMGKKSPRGPQKAEGYEGVAEELLSKAERALDAAPMADRGEKESWFIPYLTAGALIAIGGVGFLMWMGFSYLINQEESDSSDLARFVLFWLACGLNLVGGILTFSAAIMIAIYAFKQNDTVHGILSLLIGFYAVVYACLQRGRLDRELKMWGLGLFCSLSALCIFFFDVVLSGLAFSTESMGQVAFGVLILLLFVGGMLLMFAGWIFSLVVCFMDRVYHGILAIFFPVYGATYCIARRNEEPVPAKLWLGGAGCIISSFVLSFLGNMLIIATRTDADWSVIGTVLGMFALMFIAPPIVVMLVLTGLIYAAIGLHNVMFVSAKKDRVSFPTFGSATFTGMVLTATMYLAGFSVVTLLVAALMVAFSSIGGATGAALGLSFTLLLLHYTPVFFSVADMISFQRGAEYRRGLIVSGIFCVLWLITVVTTIVVLALTIGLMGMLAEAF